MTPGQPLSRASALASRYYVHPAILEHEKELVFGQTWQLVDVVICEQVQRGLRSRSYDMGRFFAKRENGVYHFQNLVGEFLQEDA